MWRYSLLVGLVACAPGDRSAVTTPDASGLPPGVWEPAPGTDRINAATLVADGDRVWFAYNQYGGSAHPQIWLTQTTLDGGSIVPPIRVDSASQAFLPTVQVAGPSVVVAFVGFELRPHVRFFDRDGTPRGSDLSIDSASADTHALALTGRSNGDLHLLTAGTDPTYEAIAFDLDPAGGVRAATPLGTTTTFTTERVATTIDANGDAVDAWDRVHDYCTQSAPYETSGAVIRNGVAEPEQVVRDTPTRGEFAPTLSPSFAAWSQGTQESPVMPIALANLGDPSSTVEIGDPLEYAYMPVLAEESPGNAALAWNTHHDSIQIANVRRDAAGTIAVGTPHTIEPVTAGATLMGIASVGSSRYVVAWIELSNESSHLYATTIDLSIAPSPRPAPRPAGSIPSRALAVRPCSH